MFTSALFANATIAAVAYCVFVLLLMHALRPDYAPRSHMISDYGVGPYGWVMTTWFLGAAAGCLMLLFGLAQNGPRSIAARFCVFLLGIASIGLAVSAFFPTDIAPPVTRTGTIHTVSFLMNVSSLILTSVLFAIVVRGDPRWRSFQPTAGVLAALNLLAFVVQFRTLHRGMPFGLANRFFVAVLFAWLLATALRLRAVSRA